MPETLSSRLADFAATAAADGTPEHVLEDTKRRVLDVLGNALAAHGDGAYRAAEGATIHIGGVPEATVIGGSSGPLPAASASLVNGTLAHSLDFDDTHLPSVLHPSASVIPAALAMGEAVGANGRRILDAAAVGNEICVRLGMAGYDSELKNSIFFENGFHATSICGTLAASVTAGLLLGFDADRLTDAIGIAASLGAGILEANRTGGSAIVRRTGAGSPNSSASTSATSKPSARSSSAASIPGWVKWFAG